MLANHHVAPAVADQGFGQFFAPLQDKAPRYGTRLVEADRWFPSSKRCSTPGCGSVNKDLTLKDRVWTCPACGVTHDRDHNAAIKLERASHPNGSPCGDECGHAFDGSGRCQTRRESHACQRRSDTRRLYAGGFGAGRSRRSSLNTDFIAVDSCAQGLVWLLTKESRHARMENGLSLIPDVPGWARVLRRDR